MLRNYLKIACRNILRNKGIFSINIAGLAIGIASCLIIMLFVVDELIYGCYNENSDEVGRLVCKANIHGEEIRKAVVMAPVASNLKEDFSEVVNVTRIRMKGSSILIVEDRIFRYSKYAYEDPNFFDIFTLPVIEGNNENPLDKPNFIVLKRPEALKLLREQEAVKAQNLRL
ncbi:ABC transporter permease [Salegentibacter sp. JZCK2]|uniref:ABC transporter permease n=1 Tax=Salegentibacter tibetensis TaxID=2873600 RepID=UPI001CCC41A8|nr:ABC transporter permease [Salegentibacter tibetensis]MBZ9731143.1 ABC transporter permease [Salegentibacter tibetensis]